MEDKAGMLSSSLFDKSKRPMGLNNHPSIVQTKVMSSNELKSSLFIQNNECLPSSTYDNSKIECLYPNNSWQDLTRIYLVLLTLTTLVVY